MGHFGINMQGTFAEYYLVREDRARRVPNDMDFCLASLAEPVCVGLEALAQARLLPGQSLLIIGDGPFGLLIARLASAQGLGRVVIAGWEDFRLQYAGAALAVNTRHAADPTFLLREAADGLGYDAAILAVGTQEAVRQGMNCLKPKGRFVIFSAISGETLVDLFTLHVNELELIGACNDDDRLDRAVELLSDTALRLEELITHRFSFEEYAQAFSLAASGHTQAIKVSIVFE
jgi:threonine dehydrogenase-like Zn-dependent dehydrogenase